MIHSLWRLLCPTHGNNDSKSAPADLLIAVACIVLITSAPTHAATTAVQAFADCESIRSTFPPDDWQPFIYCELRPRGYTSCVTGCSVELINPYGLWNSRVWGSDVFYDFPPDPKSLGQPEPEQCIGNPCNPATGTKYWFESDYESVGTLLSLNRHYNSQLTTVAGLGFGWMFSYRKRLEISGSNLIVRLGDGRGEPFSCVNGICTGSTDTVLTLAQDASGYTLIHRDKSIERYDNAGKLLSEISPAGLTSTYSYEDYTGTLLTVTGPFGHSLSFSYNTTGHISTVTNSAGQIIRYNYTNNNLTRVDYPDGTAKLYHYEDTLSRITSPASLTSTALGRYTRYSTYAYDTTGKAIRTEHAQTDNGFAQERFTLNYDSATQTTVTDAVGMRRS